MDIDIPSDDPVFANFSGKLHFTRSERTPVEFFGQQDGAERPTNSLTSVLDLSSVYGVDKMRADELRSMQGGKLKTSAGNLLPFNKNRFQNNPSSSPSFFIAGDFRSNEHPMLASIHTLFMREHNHICDELAEKFPSYDDEMLYQTARKINGAQFQKIVLDEFYPAIVGKSLPRYTGFKQRTDPTMQDVFTTAAFRIGHTMVGNVVSRRGPGGSPLPSLAMKDTFFRMTDVLNGGIEDFIRGALKVRAQEIDVKVHSTLRNFLFTGIQEEEGFDLVSLNLQRGRDHAIPSYTDIRIRLIRRGVRGVADITKNANRQSRLLTAYDGNVRDMDAWIGLMAEDHVRGGSMGPTMVALWERQFRALRDGDRFYYKNRGVFSRELRSAIPRLERLFSGSGSVLKEVLLRNTNIAAGDIPNKVFFV